MRPVAMSSNFNCKILFCGVSGGSRPGAKGVGRFWFTWPAGFSPFCHFLYFFNQNKGGGRVLGAPPLYRSATGYVLLLLGRLHGSFVQASLVSLSRPVWLVCVFCVKEFQREKRSNKAMITCQSENEYVVFNQSCLPWLPRDFLVVACVKITDLESPRCEQLVMRKVQYHLNSTTLAVYKIKDSSCDGYHQRAPRQIK